MAKDGTVKPNLFSNAEKNGCSLQREEKAEVPELASAVSNLLKGAGNKGWRAVVKVRCQTVRDIVMDGIDGRVACVYDTAMSDNKAHAEIFWADAVLATRVSEADRLELRALLRKAFDGENPIKRELYKNGAVLNLLPPELRAL